MLIYHSRSPNIVEGYTYGPHHLGNNSDFILIFMIKNNFNNQIHPTPSNPRDGEGEGP